MPAELARLRAEVGRRLLGLIVLVSALVSPATAGERQVVEIEGVRCGASYSGPELLNHGYFAVAVDLVNANDRPVVVDFEAEQQWGEEDRVRKRVRLEPYERFAFEPLLRARSGGMNIYTLTFTVGGEEGALAIGPDEWSGGSEISVMYYSRSAPAAGAAERWTQEWTARAGREYNFGVAEFSELSEQWSAYTCLEVVVLYVEGGLPDEAAMDALFAWCRAGGRLVLCGSDPRGALAARPTELKWLVPAYQARHRDSTSPHPAYHIGQGILVLLESRSLGSDVMEERGSEGAEAFAVIESTDQVRWHPGAWAPGLSRMHGVERELEDFGDLPLRGLMVLLVLFAILMGPINFLWVKRSKKPILLLVTVPGISIVTAIALVLYGILSQGLDVKVSTRSYTFLDQVDRVATTAEVRLLFAGSSPGEGMRPEQGTAVFPGSQFWTASYRSSHMFTQDLDDGRLLAGDFLPVRRPVSQLLLSDRSSRLRLDVTPVDDAVEVANALGGAVEELMLRGVDGRYHHLEGVLGAGESRRLIGGASLQDRREWSDELELILGASASESDDMPPGSYLAVVVDAGELRDSCGISVNELNGRHVVFGVHASAQGVQR